MKELIELIKSVEQDIKGLENEMWQRKIKGEKFSSATMDEYKNDKRTLESYLNGLVVAKVMIEKEMSK